MPFSINIYLRFVGIVLGIIGGIALWSVFGFWYGIWFLIAGLVLLAGYIFLGTVQSAAQLMQMQDMNAVDKRLDLTLSPKLLYSTNRAYYYLLRGTSAMNKKDLDKAEEMFLIADATGLPSDQEKGMVQFQLASLAANKNNWKSAEQYFKKAKEYKVSEPQLKAQMDQFELALKQRGQMKMGQTVGKNSRSMMYQPGGKRRRPKMR